MARRFGARGKVEGNAFERACEGKTAYPTESAAEAGLRFFRDEGAIRTNDGMEPYQCRFCKEWHFGH